MKSQVYENKNAALETDFNAKPDAPILNMYTLIRKKLGRYLILDNLSPSMMFFITLWLSSEKIYNCY